MPLMSCGYRPFGFTRGREYDRVEGVGSDSIDLMSRELGPHYLLGDRKEGVAEETDEIIAGYLKQLPRGQRLLARASMLANHLQSPATRRARERNIAALWWHPVARSAFHTLVDAITAEAMERDDGRAVLTAEEWVGATMARTDWEQFTRLTGEPEAATLDIIGRSALVLLHSELYRVPQPVIGLRSNAVILQAVPSQ